MNNFFQSAFKEAETALQPFFKESADQHGWPSDISSKMTIRVDSAGVHVEYEPDLEKAIQDLEYGDLKSRPKAALRNFSAESDRIIDLIYANKGIDHLIDKGVFG